MGRVVWLARENSPALPNFQQWREPAPFAVDVHHTERGGGQRHRLKVEVAVAAAAADDAGRSAHAGA